MTEPDRHISSSPPPDDDGAGDPIAFSVDYYERQDDDSARGWKWQTKPTVLTLLSAPVDEVSGARLEAVSRAASNDLAVYGVIRDFMEQVLLPDSLTGLADVLSSDETYISDEAVRDLAVAVYEAYAGRPTRRLRRSSPGPSTRARTSAARRG